MTDLLLERAPERAWRVHPHPPVPARASTSLRAPRGPGDDCAVVDVRNGQQLCVTVDSVVEGVHFDRAHFSPADIGHKALAVNVSDLASMGAQPTWAVCALALPPDFGTAALRGLSRGMAALAKQAGVSLVGGNFSRAAELSVTVTVAGEVPRGKALRRDAARAGDLLYVTGHLGDAGAGFALMGLPPERTAGLDRRSREALLSRQRRPVPQWEVGLLARPHARAAIDVSDGLCADVGHLAEASGLRAIIDEARLPLSPALQKAVAGGVLPGPASRWALAGGEDYVLVLAVAPARAAGAGGRPWPGRAER